MYSEYNSLMFEVFFLFFLFDRSDYDPTILFLPRPNFRAVNKRKMLTETFAMQANVLHSN